MTPRRPDENATPSLLVLGGTRFVGPAFADVAAGQGWQVTTFSRGRTGSVPQRARAIRGDRTAEADLWAIAGQTWDVVVDTWSGPPEAVALSTRMLAGRCGAYIYVSTESVYADPGIGFTEDAPLVAPAAPDGAHRYAADKRAGELLAVEHVGAGRVLIPRPGLILGPRENVGRLPYWLRRVAYYDRVLAPGPADLVIQYVDVRDLAAFSLDACARGLRGPFNVVCERGHATFGGLLGACLAATGSNVTLEWVPADVVLQHKVAPWTELPIWLPPGSADACLFHADSSAAMSAGLRCRPLQATVADTWAWLRSPDAQRAPPDTVGLSRGRETAVIEAWSKQAPRTGP